METKNYVLTKDKLLDRRLKRNESIKSGIYFGTRENQETQTELVRNSTGVALESIVMPASRVWVGSEGYYKNWNDIEALLKKVKNQYERKINVNQLPDDYYDLIDKIRLDITRRRQDYMDMTSEMTIVKSNPNYSKQIDLLEFLPFTGAFEEIKLTGDNVPMLQQHTGGKGAVEVVFYGLGHARTLEDELYNLDIYSLEKVNAAVTRAHTAMRNDLCLGQLVALTAAAGWHASQQVAATIIGTLDERYYTTIRNAIRQLYGLLDPQTNQEIDSPRLVLIVPNRVIAWDLNRVLSGRELRGEGKIINLSALPIDETWIYKGDTINVGPRPHVYPGVPAGTAYLIVPGPAGAPIYTLPKRELTMEIGRGDVLQLARERRAWYFGQAEYQAEFFGSSDEAILAALGGGYGFCIEIELPTDET